MKPYLVITIVFLLSSCSYFKKKKVTDADVIARVNDDYLYASDVLSVTKGLKGTDSLKALKAYAEGWARKKMLLQKARENIADDDIAIAEKVEEYRETLLLYEYEKALINQKLDMKISADELSSYYERLKNDFPLENDVYQLYFIKLPTDAPELDQAKKWILKPKEEEDMRKLQGYCKEVAITYSIDKGMWYEKKMILENFPVKDYDLSSLRSSGNYREYKATDAIWFMKVANVVDKGQPSPLELVKDKVMKVIIEKRKVQLLERMYEKVYQDGLKSKTFEITVSHE